MSRKSGREERQHWAFEHGTDADYLRWVSYQPSCVDGSWHQWDTDEGRGRNIACHVRRISRGAGTGSKPPFSAIPMTQAQHLDEDAYPIEWRVEQAEEHLRRWARTRKGGEPYPYCLS